MASIFRRLRLGFGNRPDSYGPEKSWLPGIDFLSGSVVGTFLFNGADWDVIVNGVTVGSIPGSGGGGTVNVAGSIEGDGTALDPIMLDGDDPTPGPSRVYGTDPDAVKGFYTLPEIAGKGLAAEILADSPVAYWKLDDAGTTAVDSTGNGFDLTYGGAIGTRQYSRLVPTSDDSYYFNQNGGGTLEANINPTGASPVSGSWSYCFVIRRGQADGVSTRLIVALNNNIGGTNAITISFGNGASHTGVTVFIDSQNIPINLFLNQPAPWKTCIFHVTKNAATKTIMGYLNGAFVGSATYATEAATILTTPRLQIVPAVAGCLTGHHAMFYGVVLPDSRIAAHAKAAGLYCL